MKETGERAEQALGFPVLSVTKSRGPMLASERFGKVMHGRDLAKYRVARRNTVVADPMLLWDGSIGLQTVVDAGLVSPDYRVYEPAADVDPRFLAYVIRSPEMLPHYQGAARGTNVRRNRIARADFLAIPLPLPPLPEQKKIAAILSSADAAVQAAQLVIDHLQIVKTATMHELLARGLRGTHKRFKMTDIGEVPEDWSVVRLGDLCRKISDGPHFSPKYVPHDEGVPFLSARNLTEDAWSLADAKYVSQRDHEEFCKRARPEPNDVLYTKGGTTGVARVNDLPFEFSVWVHIALLKTRPELVNSHFLATALNGERCYKQARLMTHGTSNQDLGLTRMVNILVPLPPLKEQQEIASLRQSFAVRLGAERAWVAALRALRAALMSVLLTGEVRVKRDTEAA